MKMSLKEEMHDDFFQDNMAKEFYTTKSPHILITRTFRHIKENSIILECPVVENEQKNSRTIFYKIKYFGKNIMFKKKKNYFNLRPENTKGNVIFFLIDNREMLQHMKKITLYAENGKRLDINCKDKSKDGHILLGLLTNNLKVMENESILLSSKDIDMLEKFRINKTKMKVSHHFNTTGKIFSFGYGPKYEKTKQHGYTIGIYSDKTKKKENNFIGTGTYVQD